MVCSWTLRLIPATDGMGKKQAVKVKARGTGLFLARIMGSYQMLVWTVLATLRLLTRLSMVYRTCVSDRNEIVKMKTGRYHAMMHLRLVASGASNSASFALCHPPHKSNTHGDMLYWLPTTILRRLCPPQLGTVWPQLDLSLAVTSHSFEFYDQPQAPFLCEWQAVQRIPWDLRLECHLAEPSRVEMGGNDIFLVTCLGDFRGYAHCDVKSC